MKVKADNSDFNSKMGKVTKTLGSLKKAAKIGAVAMAAGGAAMVGVAKKAASNADEVDKMSQKIGISRDAYQEWAFALSQSGADVAGLQMGVKTLSKAAYEASQGVSTYADNFDELGIAVTNADGSLKDQEVLLNETITALQAMDDETKRTAIASELLGRSATELAPLLNAGADSAEEMKKQAHDLGLVLGDDVIDAGVKLTDSMDQVKRAMSAATTNIGGAMLPMFQKFLNWVINHMPEIKKAVEKAFQFIEVAFKNASWFVSTYVVPAFTKIKDFWDKHGDTIKTKVKDVFDKIVEKGNSVWSFIETKLSPVFTSLYNSIEDNFPTLKETVTTAFDSILESGKNVTDMFNDDLTPSTSGFVDYINENFGSVGGMVVTNFDMMITSITDVIDFVNDLIKALDLLLETLGKIWTVNFGENLMDKFGLSGLYEKFGMKQNESGVEEEKPNSWLRDWAEREADRLGITAKKERWDDIKDTARNTGLSQGQTTNQPNNGAIMINFYDTNVMDIDRDIDHIGDAMIKKLKIHGIKVN